MLLNAQDTCRSVAQAISFLTRQRSDVAVSEFYQTTLRKSKNLTDPSKLSRANAIISTSPEIYFRQQYFQVLDLPISELELRFNKPSLSVFKDIKKLLMTSSNDNTVQLPENFSLLYEKGLDLDRSAVQLRMLPDLLRTANVEHKLSVRKVTCVGTIV